MQNPTNNPKYSSFDFEFSAAFSGVPSESFSGVRLPYVTGKDDLRILIVLDYMPTEDLRSGKLLSGVTRDNLNNIIGLAQKVFLRREVDPSWMAVTFNAYRTAGKPPQYQQQAREEFTLRLNQLIKRYRPDIVLGFGRQVMQALIPYQIGLTEGKWTSWLGVPVECTTESTHVYRFVGSLSLNPLSDARSSDASLIGYMARNVASALSNRHLFCIDDKRIKAHRSVLIDTIPKFDKLMAMIRAQPRVAVDTEANNLNRVVNKLLTIQFAKCPDFGYLVPIYHKDTPFDARELKYITTQLRLFFEGRNKNEFHIYVNAQFDLNLMRTQLGIRYYANRIYDCLGAEYCLDENLKYLKSSTGDWFYSLGNLAIQYGTTAYIGGKFGKADRANVATTDLKDLQYYCLSSKNYVLMGDNSLKPIADIVPGDVVRSFNHEKLEYESKPVTKVSAHSTKERMFEITTATGSVVRLTESHEVWSVTRGTYVKTRDLHENEEVLLHD